MRNKFIKHNIPYDELDKEMIEIVDVLNFHLGLKTKYCCYGHDSSTSTYVVFDDFVTDEQIYSLAEKVATNWKSGICFKKWVRGHDGRIVSNWILESIVRWANPNDSQKKEHLDNIVEILKGV